MRTPRSFLAPALAAVLASVAIGTADDDPVNEKSWRDEKTWPAFVTGKHLKVADTDDRPTQLLKERFNAGQQELRNRYKSWLQGVESLPPVYDAAQRVIDARLDIGGRGPSRMEILTEKLAFARVVERQAEKVSKTPGRPSDVYCATYFRAAAELELAEQTAVARGPDGERLTALRKERRDALQEAAKTAEKGYRAGVMDYESMKRTDIELLDAELDLAMDRPGRVAVRERLVEQFKTIEKEVAERVAAARASSTDLLEAKAARLKAEIDLLLESADKKRSE